MPQERTDRVVRVCSVIVRRLNPSLRVLVKRWKRKLRRGGLGFCTKGVECVNIT